MVVEKLSEESRQRHQAAAKRRNEWFIKGPLPVAWFEKAAKLPGRAVVVGLLIWLESGRRNRRRVTLSRQLFERFGLDRHAVRRGINSLESAGLIAVERQRGRKLAVTIKHRRSRQS